MSLKRKLFSPLQQGLDSEEIDRSGVDLGATGRLALMSKLAEGTGMKLPQVVIY